jgi:hypothetical protein
MSQGLNYRNSRNVKSSFEYKEYQPLIYGISVAVYDKIKDDDIKRSLAKLTVDNYNGNMAQAYEKLITIAEKVRKAYSKFYRNKNHLSDIVDFASSSYESNHLLYEKLFLLLSLIINHISDLNTDSFYSSSFIRPDTMYLSKKADFEGKTFSMIMNDSFEFLKWANETNRSTEPVHPLEYETLIEYYKDSTKNLMVSMGIAKMINENIVMESNRGQFIAPAKTKMNGLKSFFGMTSRHSTPIEVSGGRRSRKTRKQRKTRKNKK